MSAIEQREDSATSSNSGTTLEEDGFFTITNDPAGVIDPETAGIAVEIEIKEESEEEGTTCPECGADVPAGATECPGCGAEMAEMSSLPMWESELAYENLPTSDGRALIAGKITNRDLPLTLMCQTVTAEGHMGAEVCGKMTSIWREDRPEMGVGVVAIMASGEFSDELMGPTAASLVEDDVMTGVSVDIAPTRKAVLERSTMREVPEEELDFDRYMNGEYLIGIEGEIMGATLVPFAAFADAKMRIVEEAVVASAADGTERTFTLSGATIKLVPRTITAAAAGIAPLRPPKDWFFTEEPEGKLPLTVTDDGRIFGHLATWDQCHHGFANECVLARPSRSGYSFFHVGQIKTREGEMVDIGRLVVSESPSSGHAGINMSAAEASRYYDKTACVGAFVRAVDGKYGIWLSGAVRSDCPAERVRDMIANPPSGDWRYENGGLELIAALSVPVPGFPVPRYEYALVASAEDMEVQALVASGYYELDPPALSRAEQRKRDVLLRKAKSL